MITPVVTHSNHHALARSMHRALGAKNKFDFIDGRFRIQLLSIRVTCPGLTATCARLQIMNSVEELIACGIVFFEIPLICGMS